MTSPDSDSRTSDAETPDDRAARRARRRAARLARIDNSIPSPCISVCQLDRAAGHCIGCYRSIDEIREWPIMSAEEKTATLSRAEARKAERSG